jgi:2-oxoglutarate ferredoxin oxidoreductase subunit alpha
MMEPAELPQPRTEQGAVPEWALSGAAGRPKRLIASIQLQPEALEAANRRLQAKIATIAENEVRTVEYLLDDADLVVVGFGSAGRIAQSAVAAARQQGIRAGLLRPITLFPFPSERLAGLAARGSGLLVVEMNAGQMLDDVKIAAAGLAPVRFYGRMGGVVPFPDEILEAIVRLDQETMRKRPLPNIERFLNHLPRRAGIRD